MTDVSELTCELVMFPDRKQSLYKIYNKINSKAATSIILPSQTLQKIRQCRAQWPNSLAHQRQYIT